MSKFAVTVEKIGQVWKHPNADRLDIASVEGLAFRFCVGKGQYEQGDVVIYIPVDAILPDSLIEKLDIRNYLSGAQKNRVKTAQIRGQISQGLVCPLGAVLPDGLHVSVIGEDVAPILGITKYEPPEIFTQGGKLLTLPDGLGVYDIEGADRYPNVLDVLMDRPCHITEKIEGTNAALVRRSSGEIITCQRNHSIRMDGGASNTYEDAFKAGGFCGTMEVLSQRFPNLDVALRGELIGPGIQKNIYKLAFHNVRLFDIKVGGRYLNPDELDVFFPKTTDKVPLLAKCVTLREWLDGRSVQEASNGFSLINPKTRREGIVIKPMIEDRVDFGDGYPQRLIIKQRSPIYLAKEGDK